MVDIVQPQISEEVQNKQLDDNRKAELLAEMRRTVRSKLERAKERIELAARTSAKELSLTKDFKAFQAQIQAFSEERKEKVDVLGEDFKKEDEVLEDEQIKVRKTFERTFAKIQTKRNRVGEKYDLRISKVRDKYTDSIRKVQNKMHDKYDTEMQYVDFRMRQNGAVMVKAVALYRDDVRGLVSDHPEMMDSIEAWNTFRVGVFSRPDFEEAQKEFGALVKGL